MQILLSSPQSMALICVRLSLYLIKGQVTFWWDWDFRLAFHQISLNGICYQSWYLVTPPSNPLQWSSFLLPPSVQKTSLSERIFVTWVKYILLFSAYHKAMLMCIWDHRESMLRHNWGVTAWMFSSNDHPQSAICVGLCTLEFDCACMQSNPGLFVPP